MELEEIKEEIKALTIENRRKIALYILELEKDHLQGTIGPQIVEDLDKFSRVVYEAFEKIKKAVTENLNNRRGKA